MPTEYPNIPLKEHRRSTLRFVLPPCLVMLALFTLIPRLVTGSFESSILAPLPWWSFYAIFIGATTAGFAFTVMWMPAMFAGMASDTLGVGEDGFTVKAWSTPVENGMRTKRRVVISYSRIELLAPAAFVAPPRVAWRAVARDSIPPPDSSDAGVTILTDENEVRLQAAYDRWKRTSRGSLPP